MGLPAREYESEFMYVPYRTFDLPEKVQDVPYNKFRRFYSLYRYMQKAGPRFWGIEVTDTTDPSAHLVVLQNAAKSLQENKDDSIIKSYIHAPAPDLIDIAHGNLIQKVADFSQKPDKRGRRDKLDITYAEAHDVPGIRLAAMGALHDEDDMTMEIVRCFEGWRYAMDLDLPDDQTETARFAYETFFFTVGSGKFIPALGAASTAYLKNEK